MEIYNVEYVLMTDEDLYFVEYLLNTLVTSKIIDEAMVFTNIEEARNFQVLVKLNCDLKTTISTFIK